MTLFQNKYRVESNRLRGYDYSSIGAYFITICTIDRGHFFGEVFDGEMVLNPLGKQTHQCWMDIPQHFPFVTIDEFVVMPNHVHGIIIINDAITDAATEETNEYSSRTMANPDAITHVTTDAITDAIYEETNNHSSLQSPPHSSTQPSTPSPSPFSSSVPLPSPFTVPFRSPSKTVGSIVRGFKIGVTKWARQNSHIHNIWQPNYHDRIIKNERALNAIRNYIRNNPRKWRDE